MRIGVITVVYAEFPAGLFESVRGKTKHDVQWIVHSHTSDSLIEAELLRFCADNDACVVFHRRNRGLARSWNDGILKSFEDKNELTLVINDDISFVPGGFDQWIEFVAGYDGLCLAFLNGLESTGSPHAGSIRQQDFACFAVGPTAFDVLGAFDENFFPAYREDSDYILRVEKAKLTVVVDKRTLVEHARGKTTRQSPEIKSVITDVKEQNRLFFVKKWGGEFGETRYDLPFESQSLKIDWRTRRAPHGPEHDRADLIALETAARRVIGAVDEVERKTEVPVPAPSRSEAEAASTVTAIYQALLGREPEDVNYYAQRLLNGEWSVKDVCEIVRNSAECREFLGKSV